MMEAASLAAGGAARRGEDWLRAARLARLLSWLSLASLGIEGVVAIVAGVLAGSIALIAFGLDSASKASPG
jgi:divalent metal cation (Fe/Co/Zn/Cd) transporter